jgi:G3E family GTPase
MKLAITGGFLGSGKTTAIVAACRQLMNQKKKVAVITNDQGDQQVDSAFVKGLGIPVREVANGCFCCNYDQLDEHLQSLKVEEQPDVIFAESVGSCTDLIATIAKPLKGLRPDVDASISVFTDADLLLSLLEGRSSFLEDSVRYIYKKQLEEADILILNKIDLLTAEQSKALEAALKPDFGSKLILHQNSLNDEDISRWMEAVEFAGQGSRSSLDIDYEIYGDGEARLAWLDKSITIHSDRGDSVFITRRIIGLVFDQIQANQFTIGHLKFFLETADWQEKISFTTTSTSRDVRIGKKESSSTKVLINARVQCEPRALQELVDRVLTNVNPFSTVPLQRRNGQF